MKCIFIGENGSYIAKGAKLISTNTLKKGTSTSGYSISRKTS